jgi:ornithine cyclodeaminase/alanine dehydrogenase-like protein (mu-crystallin family)
VRLLGAQDVAKLSYTEAADALEGALRSGFDPEGDVPRSSVPVGGGRGELLVMPSVAGAVKLVTVGGDPRIQGVCVVFDPESLAPVAVVDGIALTNLRTAAVSALAARRLAAPDPRTLVVYGRGPQGEAHVAALREVLPSLMDVEVVGRSGAPRLEGADVVVCATTAREPVFDGARVADRALVIAIGSHVPDAAELDAGLMRRAQVVVESRASAFREAGDVLLAGVTQVSTLAEDVAPDLTRPRVFKSTGMAWEDAVVASAVVAAACAAAD